MRLLLIVSILPVAILATVNYFTSIRSYEKLQVDQQQLIEEVVTTQLEAAQIDLKNVVNSLAKEPELAAVLQSTDREEIELVMQSLFEKLQQEHQLAVLELGDVQGNVHVRGHNLEKYGDNKFETIAIQETLKGNVLSGLEYGNSGLALRAFAPIEVDGEIIGTLQIGVNDHFVQLISEMLPDVNMYFTNEHGELQGATSADVQVHEASIAKALEGAATRNLIEDEYRMESYLPFYDPSGTKLSGTVMLIQDITVSQTAKETIVFGGGLTLLLTLIGAFGVSVYYSRSITNPIKQTVSVLQTLREGDLTKKVELENRGDEIGQMMTNMEEMQEHLHGTIANVAKAAQTVSDRSHELNSSAQDVSQGAQAIAEVMEDISQGTERQTNAVTEISQNMNAFTQRLNVVTGQGEQLKHSSDHIYSLSAEGAELMKVSSGEMSEITEMMDKVVTQMSLLNTKATEISSFISIIEDVANQTNLLALNASIEAARAGVHGNGFAVVADEVRKLAEQVAQTVVEVTTIVSTIQAESKNVSTALLQGFEKVESGAEQLSRTSITFNDIEIAVADITKSIATVISNLAEMNSESQEINGSLLEITAINEEITASIEETTATVTESSATMQNVANAANELTILSEQLNDIVTQYKI